MNAKLSKNDEKNKLSGGGMTLRWAAGEVRHETAGLYPRFLCTGMKIRKSKPGALIAGGYLLLASAVASPLIREVTSGMGTG